MITTFKTAAARMLKTMWPPSGAKLILLLLLPTPVILLILLFRDLAKDKGIDYKMSNKIAKTISGHISLNKALTSFTELMNSNKDVKKFIQTLPTKEAQDFVTTIDTLIGNVRNQTIAGGGVIISSKPLYDVMPLKKSKEGDLVTEWQIDELAKMKFLKIDMLGLSTLSIVKEVMDKVGVTLEDLYKDAIR